MLVLGQPGMILQTRSREEPNGWRDKVMYN